MELWQLWFALLTIAFVAGFVHSAIGFGFGIVALAILPFVLEIRSAHVVVSLASVPMLIMAAWTYRHGWDRDTLVMSMLGAFFFLPLGMIAFEFAPVDWLVRGTGIAVLLMVMQNALRRNESKHQEPTRWSCFSAGALAGFLAGAVSIAGPPIATFALRQSWSQERFKAFVTQCLLVISIYKALAMAARGFVTFEPAMQSLGAAPLAMIGVIVGQWASRRLAPQRFKLVVATALILASTLMIYRGAPNSKPTTNVPFTNDQTKRLR